MNSIFLIWQQGFGSQQFRSLQSKPTHSHTNTHLYQCTTHLSAVAVSGPAFASCPFQPPPAVVFTGDHDPNDVATRSSLALLGGVITTLAKWPRRFVVRLGLVVVNNSTLTQLVCSDYIDQQLRHPTELDLFKSILNDFNILECPCQKTLIYRITEVHKKHLPF